MSDTNNRFFLLSEALKKCTFQQDLGKQPIFNVWERIFINQERAKLLQGIEDYKQDEKLEEKIQKTKTQ